MNCQFLTKTRWPSLPKQPHLIANCLCTCEPKNKSSLQSQYIERVTRRLEHQLRGWEGVEANMCWTILTPFPFWTSWSKLSETYSLRVNNGRKIQLTWIDSSSTWRSFSSTSIAYSRSWLPWPRMFAIICIKHLDSLVSWSIRKKSNDLIQQQCHIFQIYIERDR